MHEEEAGPCAPPPSRTQVPQPSTREAREDEEHVLLDTFEVRAPTSNATGEARRGFSRPHKPKRSPDENPVISEGALPIPNSSSARAIPFGTMLPWSNIHGHDPPAMTEHCGMHRTSRHISIPCSNHLGMCHVTQDSVSSVIWAPTYAFYTAQSQTWHLLMLRSYTYLSYSRELL